MANQVKFFRGLKGSYNTTTHANAIYFASDTHELIMNNVSYGVDPTSSAILLSALTDVKFVSPTTIQFTRGTGDSATTVNIELPIADTSAPGLMTVAQVTKLNGIEEGAQVNKIEDIVIDGLTGTIKDKVFTIEGLAKAADVYTKTAAEEMVDGKIETALASVYEYKGSVGTYEALPSEGVEPGDVYNVEAEYREEGIDGKVYPAGTNWAWDGTKWDALGGLVDLSKVESKIADNTTAIGLNTQAINNEVTRATGIEDGLRTDLGQKTDLLNPEGSAFARIAALRSEMDILAGDGNSIASQIEAAINNLKGTGFDSGTLSSLEDKLEAEIERAGKAEVANANAITAEKQRAEGIEQGLQQQITSNDTDISNLQQQDQTHSDAIAANTAAIAVLNGSDTTAGSVAKAVKDAVSAETSEREAADEAIDARLDVLEGYFTGEGEGTVADQIADAVAEEARLRQEADETLQGNIDTVSEDLDEEIERAKAAEKVNADAITALTKVVNDNETDIEGKVEALAGRVSTAESTITGHTTNITNNTTAITNLQNNTVNGIKISDNPVLGGAHIALTDYSADAKGFIAATDTVNSAIAKIEQDLIWHEA